MAKYDVDYIKDAVKILESSPDLYLILNKNLKIVGVTETYLDATMTERSKIIGRDIFDIFKDDPKVPESTGVDNLRFALNRVLINKKPDAMTIEKYDMRQKKIGQKYEIRYWSSQNTPVFDKKNNVQYIIHRIFDVTPFIQQKDLSALMEAEMNQHIKNIDEVNKQLRVTDAVYHAIINAIPDAMLTINKEGIITDVNKALEILFGYDRHELLGQEMEILMPKPYRTIHKVHIDKYFKAPKLRAMGVGRELFGLNKNGDVFPVEIGLSPLQIEKDQFAVAIIHDISLRIQNTKNLQLKEIDLKKANTQLIVEKKNLDISNKKVILLTEFSETLIACKNKDEMVAVISSYVSKLLDFSSGVLYFFDITHKYLEAITSWGEIDDYEKIIPSDGCWAIRRDVVHITSNEVAGAPCAHIMNIKHNFSYICIPVAAQNEIFGLVYLEIESNNSDILEDYNLLITMVSKTIALAIANVTLRNLLREQSIRDSLTGLYNRRFLDEYLMKQIFYAK